MKRYDAAHQYKGIVRYDTKLPNVFADSRNV
jgi:hypothetical protein